MRKAIARRMSQSKQQAPHFYVSCEIAMDAAVDITRQLNESRSGEERITLTALMLKAVALSLADEPEFNAHWTDEGHELIDDINLGVAIDLPAGLIAPAIVDCGNLDVSEFSKRLKDLAERAKEGKLRAAEINEATFTLSNLGMFDVSSFTAIVTPPQVAILATGRSQAVPRVVSGEIVIQTIMTATLSSDHRAVDGVGAARFLGGLKKRLESPQDWLTTEK
jgi:pyruvate dehydrogenase E2 component (dihydrolipoamide acetyltransferase)